MLLNLLNRICDPAIAGKLYEWLITSGLRIAFIAGGAFILMRTLNGVIGRFKTIVAGRSAGFASAPDMVKLVITLTSLLRSIVFVLVFGVAVVMVLKELGMDVAPIIAGAGILGLIVSFGTQNLIRDIISGFFIIMEDQVRVGDATVINGKNGTVEEIKFRTIAIRDVDGTLHIFPNGSINQLSNQSRNWSKYIVDVRVAYRENMDYVLEVLREVGDGLEKDKDFASLILEPLEILGVVSFGPSEVLVRCMIKPLPQKQWVVGKELRKRIVNSFGEKGIAIPFPHLSLYYGERSRPFDVRLERGVGEGVPGN